MAASLPFAGELPAFKYVLLSFSLSLRWLALQRLRREIRSTEGAAKRLKSSCRAHHN